MHVHASFTLVLLSLLGDVCCIALAAFGDLTHRYRLPHLFWWILWLAQLPLGVQGVLGVVLLVGGAHPRTPFHLMYGALIVLTLVALYALTPGGRLRRAVVRDERSFRESRWLLLLCAFLTALVARAYVTGVVGR